MERHERYDPEDIEILLRERDFDALLEEERAYVLRHVSGPEEYRAMRELLRTMADDPSRPGPPEADPRVRAAVLEAFQREQRPHWRIWLNVLANAFWPPAAAAWVRPAIALGTLAVLVMSSVAVVRWIGDGGVGQGLAEVKPLRQQESTPLLDARKDNSSDRTLDTVTSRIVLERSTPPSPSLSSGVKEEALKGSEAEEMEYFTRSAGAMADLDEAEVAEDAQVPAAAEPVSTGHVVTADELMRNMSLVHAAPSGAVSEQRAKMTKAADAYKAGSGRSLGQDAALLDLLTAGW